MAFRQLNPASLARFNSSISADFIDAYDKFVDSKIVEERSRIPHRTFAPSQLRCNRRSWFRLRGTIPDTMPKPDRGLQFTADIGTACHRIIQTNLKEMLQDDWISLEDYMEVLKPDYKYICTPSEDSLEYFLDIEDPPVRFAVDGVIRLHGKYYLLEIKTCEHSVFNELASPRLEHIDQVYGYSTLLKLNNVLMIYVDRLHGYTKCYELNVPEYVHEETWRNLEYVMDMNRKNLAPKGLPVGDKWCSPNYCPYFKKCQEYGR